MPVDTFSIRMVQEKDARALWQLANDPVTRENSLLSARISWEDHLRWFYEALRMKDRLTMYVACLGPCVVGQLRFFEDSPGSSTVSIGLAQGYRGKGLGKKLLSGRLGFYLSRNPQVDRLRAVIKRTNTPSTRLFTGQGFKIAATSNETLILMFDRR